MIGKTNMFAAAVQHRQQEQEQIEAHMMGAVAESEAAPLSAAEDSPPMKKRKTDSTTITLSISKEDKVRVKSWAIQNDTNVSEMLHKWIADTCVPSTISG